MDVTLKNVYKLTCVKLTLVDFPPFPGVGMFNRIISTGHVEQARILVSNLSYNIIVHMPAYFVREILHVDFDQTFM